MKSLERAVGALIAIVACGSLASIGIVACTDDPTEGSPDASADGTADLTTAHQADAPVTRDSGDAGEGSAPDAADTSVDEAPLLNAYPGQLRTGFCHHLAKCCVPFDAGAFDQTKCEQNFLNSGGFLQTGVAVSTGGTTGGHLAYDPAAAATCLADIDAVDCTSDPSAHWMKMRTDCWAAMTGK